MPDYDDDYFELPKVAVRPTSMASSQASALTEAQKGKLIDGGVAVATGALEAVKAAIVIWHIRESSAAKVAEINADTGRLRIQNEGDVEKMREARARIRDGGATVVDILRAAPAVLGALGEADRVKFIDQLPAIIESALQTRV